MNKPTSRHQAELDSLMMVFFNEAHQRGRVIDPTGVTVEFGHLLPRSGSCRPKSYPKVVTIDSITWRAANRNVREMLLFHELGHCLLELSHDNAQLPLGECQSWMRENDKSCMVNTVNPVWRSYYLDVLFSGVSHLTPPWYFANRTSSTSVEVWSAPLRKVASFTGFVLDTAITADGGDWRVEALIPFDDHGYVAVRINEYMYEYVKWRGSSEAHESAAVVQYRNQENNWFKSRQLPLLIQNRTVSLQKIRSTIYVAVDDSTSLCIPVSTAEVHVVAYNTFRNGGLSIRIPTPL